MQLLKKNKGAFFVDNIELLYEAIVKACKEADIQITDKQITELIIKLFKKWS